MINVYDVSAYIYAGMNTNFGKKAKYSGIPTGGIYNLMRAIASAIKNKDIVVLTFDSWTNASSILPGYKGGRSRVADVRFQVDLAYQYLKNTVPNCYKFEGYEADWIAASVFDEVVAMKDFYISGYTVDLDWAHNIVNEKTQLLPASTNFYLVNKDNFEQIVWNKNINIPFNTITFSKVLFGDASDGVSPMYVPGKYDLESLFKIYCQFCIKNGLDNRLKSTALNYVNTFKEHFGEKAYDELLKRIDVFYPRPLPNRGTLSFDQINPESLSKLLSLTGCKSICKGLDIPFIDNMGELQEELRKKYIEELGQTSKTRLFAEKPVEEVLQIKDRGGFK